MLPDLFKKTARIEFYLQFSKIYLEFIYLMQEGTEGSILSHPSL